ncbi:MAG: phosphate transport system regulatory protein PhoU [Candidatus Marinimicrobia bacterium]|nr:phosphate transport system regulatory protein PhoU [Candidatus Neomarinimicrobiota bacterium]
MEHEINKLKKMVSQISTKVEESLNLSIKALMNSDSILANNIIDSDHEIDSIEIDIEEECLKILALHQPVAIDLRYIISILKINNDLERIGDLSTNISRVVILLSESSKIDIPDEINIMSDIVSKMLKNSLDALFNKKLDLAISVQKMDDKVDDINSKMNNLIQNKISNDSHDSIQLMKLLSISRYLERTADHCTNIAEDVEYLINGEITRHHLDS